MKSKKTFLRKLAAVALVTLSGTFCFPQNEPTEVILTIEQARFIYEQTLNLESITNEMTGIIYSQDDYIRNVQHQMENDAIIAKKKSRRKLWIGIGIGSAGASILYSVLKSLLTK